MEENSESGIQNAICVFFHPPPKKTETRNPRIISSTVVWREHGTLCGCKRVEGALSIKSIPPRNLECLSHECNYRESVIKKRPRPERSLEIRKPLEPMTSFPLL